MQKGPADQQDLHTAPKLSPSYKFIPIISEMLFSHSLTPKFIQIN